MEHHPGLIVRVNGKTVACVSSENLNIIAAHIHGDVLSTEIATIDVTGGFYGEPEETRHLTWIPDLEVTEADEIEIGFQDVPENSHNGKTLQELFPEPIEPGPEERLTLQELAKQLEEQPRIRDSMKLAVALGSDAPRFYEVTAPEYSFSVSVMWDWKSNDDAKLWVSGASIQSIAEQRPGQTYLRTRLEKGQFVRVRIGT